MNNAEKKVVEKAKTFAGKAIDKMETMTRSEREMFWIRMSEFEKKLITVAMLSKAITLK